MNPEKIALMGVSLGGYLAARATAYEDRIFPLIANDGVCDYGSANLKPIAADQWAAAMEAVRAKKAPEFDRRLAQFMETSPAAEWALMHGTFVTDTSSSHAYIAATLDYNHQRWHRREDDLPGARIG